MASRKNSVTKLQEDFRRFEQRATQLRCELQQKCNRAKEEREKEEEKVQREAKMFVERSKLFTNIVGKFDELLAHLGGSHDSQTVPK